MDGAGLGAVVDSGMGRGAGLGTVCGAGGPRCRTDFRIIIGIQEEKGRDEVKVRVNASHMDLILQSEP